MLKAHFRTFFEGAGNRLHFAAHSHNPWPDVTRAAHLEYWDDSVRLTTRKWGRFFDEIVPEAQRHVARLIKHTHPDRIAFAPNTHELVVRLLSCLDWSRPPHIVTTASEFHSFARQVRRLEEAGAVKVTRVPVEPYASFPLRFMAAARGDCDLVFFSQVFFDSAFHVRDLAGIVAAVPDRALVAIDGYHAFCALPVDLSAIASRVFYLAGGYKYAQAGENACFMAAPPGMDLRPISTGWVSDFGRPPASPGEPIAYGRNAMHYWGSTFDGSGLYRFNAVMRLYEGLGIGPEMVRAHVAELQARFLDGIAKLRLKRLPAAALTPGREFPRGNFCAFELANADLVEAALAAKDVLIDRRGTRLRIGFGVYHDQTDVVRLLERLRSIDA